VAAYHCTAKVVSRAKGQSAIAKAAYNARSRLNDEATGEVKNYTRKAEEVLFSGIFATQDAPAWVRDRGQLWNRAEAAETRKNSQLAREIEIALPHELTQQQREWLLKDFVRENFMRAGMVADVNMHGPHPDGDQRNVHAHILLTTRRIDGDGFGEKAREWNDKALYNEWREDLAEKGARALERAGFDVEAERWRYGHLTNREQQLRAIERGDMEFAKTKGQEPSKHLGPEIKELLNRGLVSEVQERRAFEAANENSIRAELIVLRSEHAAIERAERQLLQAAAWERRPDKPLSDTVADIRISYALSDSAGMFQDALAERGLWLARTDAEDIWRSKIDAGGAERQDRYSPVLEMDQIVAVDTRGRAYTLGVAATGEDRKEVSAFLCSLDAAPLPSIAELRMEFNAERRECIDTDQAGREQQTRHNAPEHGDGPEHVTAAAGKLGGTVMRLAADAAETILGKLGDISASAPTPEMKQARRDAVEAKAEAAQLDWKRYVNDEDYRRQQLAREAQQLEQQRQDEYQRERERGRDR